MEANLTILKAWLQQLSLAVPMLTLSSSSCQDWPEYGEEATQEEGEASTIKSKGKTGDQPKQAKGGADALPRKLPQHQNLQPQKQVPARIPQMPQPRFPPRTPPSQPSKTPMRKPHQTLQIMSKLTNRQEKYG